MIRSHSNVQEMSITRNIDSVLFLESAEQHIRSRTEPQYLTNKKILLNTSSKHETLILELVYCNYSSTYNHNYKTVGEGREARRTRIPLVILLPYTRIDGPSQANL